MPLLSYTEPIRMAMSAELYKKRYIRITFPYDHRSVARIKRIPGARFQPADRGGPAWIVTLDFKMCRELREQFGPPLVFSDELLAWGQRRKRDIRRARHQVMLPKAELSPDNPLGGWLRPYQTADVAYMASRDCLNTNEPGLGKTAEVIAAVFESGLHEGAHLVVTPKTSLDTVWRAEIERWSDLPVYSGIESLRHVIPGEKFWLLLNAEAARQERVLKQLLRISWATMTIDEYREIGISNPGSVTSKAMRKLGRKAQRRWALSGTPMGGRPLNLWGALAFVSPQEFTSRWTWAGLWLDVTSNGFGHEIGDLKKGRESEFYRLHAPWILRRLKSEVLPDLPPKTRHDIWCKMSASQAKQYQRFIDDAELRFETGKVVGAGILAEYTHSRILAFSKCKLEDDRLLPTEESSKLKPLHDNLKHLLVGEGKKALVITQFSRVADLVHNWLQNRGFSTLLLKGGMPSPDRENLINEFQSGQADIVVMTTKCGGVSITLDAAESVHFLDETWDPDNQSQAEDRAHRGNTTHPVDVFFYRSIGTIDEQVQVVTMNKAVTSTDILDIRRNALAIVRAHGVV